jgi:hypothetical protein
MKSNTDFRDKIIAGIEASLTTGNFQDYENEFVELKDLSMWNE